MEEAESKMVILGEAESALLHKEIQIEARAEKLRNRKVAQLVTNSTLSKEHMKDAHIACHQQKVLTVGNEALKNELAAINTLNAQLGFELFFYQPGDLNSTSLDRKEVANIQQIVPNLGSSFKAVFCHSLTKSPFVKRLRHGKVKFKQIRPKVIVLNPNNRETKPKYKEVKAQQYKRGISKIQVVLPIY